MLDRAKTAAAKRPIRERQLQRRLERIAQGRAEALAGADPVLAPAMRQRFDYAEEAARLTHEATLLRDKEQDARRNLSPFLAVRLVQYRGMEKQLAERHAMEHRALTMQGRSQGLSGAEPKSVERLNQRQEKERQGIREMRGRDLSNTAFRHAKAGARKVVLAPAKAMRKLTKAHEKATGRGGNHALKRDLDRVESSAHGLLTAAGSAAAKTALTAVTETAKGLSHQTKHVAEAAQVTARAVATGLVSPIAAAKEAGSGYAKVGGEATKTAAKDFAEGAKNTAKEAGAGAKETLGQGLQSIASFGVGAMPQEIQAAVGVLKEGTKATVQTMASLVRLDLVGAATGAGKGALQVAGEATKGVKGELGLVGKPLDLASKIPVIGLIPSLAKHAAELSLGAGSVAGKTKSIDLEL